MSQSVLAVHELVVEGIVGVITQLELNHERKVAAEVGF
jgi:hypothetical protein